MTVLRMPALLSQTPALAGAACMQDLDVIRQQTSGSAVQLMVLTADRGIRMAAMPFFYRMQVLLALLMKHCRRLLFNCPFEWHWAWIFLTTYIARPGKETTVVA